MCNVCVMVFMFVCSSDECFSKYCFAFCACSSFCLCMRHNDGVVVCLVYVWL